MDSVLGHSDNNIEEVRLDMGIPTRDSAEGRVDFFVVPFQVNMYLVISIVDLQRDAGLNLHGSFVSGLVVRQRIDDCSHDKLISDGGFIAFDRVRDDLNMVNVHIKRQIRLAELS